MTFFCVFSAQEKEVTIKDPRTGKNQVVVVKVWNETVANLTLMALGSSAPEIMLSVIEIWAKGFEVISKFDNIVNENGPNLSIFV